MAVILLIEDQPDIGTYEADVLESAGHRIIRCVGGPTLFGACPLLQRGRCSLVDSADMIVFSLPMFSMRGRTYRGEHLLRAYRSHSDYGRLPMLIVSLGTPADLPGTGPLERVDKFSSPNAVLEAVARLLPGTMLTPTRASRSGAPDRPLPPRDASLPASTGSPTHSS